MFVDYMKVVPEFRPDAEVYKRISFNDFDTEIQSDEIASTYGWEDFFDEVGNLSEDDETIIIDTYDPVF